MTITNLDLGITSWLVERGRENNPVLVLKCLPRLVGCWLLFCGNWWIKVGVEPMVFGKWFRGTHAGSHHRILGFQPSGNLFRRPVQNQFTRNDVLQLHVDEKKAALGPKGRLPGFAVGLTGSIRRTATMTGNFPAHGRSNPLQAFSDLANRRAGSERRRTAGTNPP